MSNEETTMGTGELIPTPGPSASLEKLQRAYQQFESGDAPEYLKVSGLATRYRSSAGVVIQSMPADPVEGLGCTEWEAQDEGKVCVASQPVVRLFAWIP